MKYLSIILLLVASVAHAQLTDKQLQEMRDNAAKLESTTAKFNNVIEENMRVRDSLNMEEFSKQKARNLDAFMAQRREQEKKTTTRMYWRIGFGVLMLVILGVGMARKKKQKIK
jgi:uncharacterized iron-regulated protein